MARDLTSGMQAAVVAKSLTPIFFYEGEFSGGTLRLTSAAGITWNGQIWAAGHLIGIGAIEETTEIRASGLQITLGFDASVLQTALAQVRSGKPGRVWIGVLDSSGAIIADPYLAFEGRLDVSDIVMGGEVCTVQIAYESRLIDLERARERRYTTEDQHIEYPDDTGFDGVPALQEAQTLWLAA